MKRLLCILLLSPLLGFAQVDTTAFGLLDLHRKGLEEVRAKYTAGDVDGAASALLDYYRSRTAVAHPDLDLQAVEMTPGERQWADDGLRHRFFVHTGYQPSFFYGDDIDWTYWPVRDNELRWQLHRHKWWVPMGKAYVLTGDKKYVREWMKQYDDWVRKNPLTELGENYRRNEEAKHMPEDNNERFAWRPLEVSDRLEFQTWQFALFLKGMTSDFLTRFLVNYHRQAGQVIRNYSDGRNHLLFEAQRVIYAGVFFPEYKDAPAWRKSGAQVLNRELAVQVYPDGMQYELDPHYHLEAANIFFKAARMMDLNGYLDEFPKEYLPTIGKMIRATYNYDFPDYSTPLFSDTREISKAYMLDCYRNWAKVFRDDAQIRWFATEGREGRRPGNLSTALRSSGFYIFRNGWDTTSTVMVLKAGPPAFWHNQPDNGTFELWHAGRNFFPDSGSYLYSGDERINALRAWHRRTASHNTLTLDGRDLETTDSRCIHWSTGRTDVLSYENPSYRDLTHRRTVWFVDRKCFVILDEAVGKARGEVALNFHLCEGEVGTDTTRNALWTRFADSNNLVLQCSHGEMEPQTGWVSYRYNERSERPAYKFAVQKTTDEPVRFVTVIRLVGSPEQAPETTAVYRDAAREVRIRLDGKNYKLKIPEK